MNVPWIEKYRPKEFHEIVLNTQNKTFIENMIDNDDYPNMLFYGPPGTGKTTTILCLISMYKKKHECTKNYIHLNASHERGIDVIRNQILQFTLNTTFFKKEQKFVLLDEMDSLTKQAQKQLMYLIKCCYQKKNVTFILICNYLNKVIPSIRNSLLTLHFNQTTKICDSFIHKCLEQEKKHIPQQHIDHIKHLYVHDLRSILNALQDYQSNTIILNNNIFEHLLHKSHYQSLYEKLTLQYDDYTILVELFHYLYHHYTLDNEILETTKELLLSCQNETSYVMDKYLPLLRIKLKKN